MQSKFGNILVIGNKINWSLIIKYMMENNLSIHI